MKILFINAVCGVGSTGRIVTDLMEQAKHLGHTVKIACSTVEPIKGVSSDEVIIVGSKQDYYIHNALSRITDHEGLYSKAATRKLVKQIQAYNPDIVHLHNLHGHWINYEILFAYLAKNKIRVIWTLHDCWAFTGHCSHFSILKCEQWKTHCSYCSGLRGYPMCYGRGDVSKNFDRKRKAFTSVENLTIVTPSEWLSNLVKTSFLSAYSIRTIHNKIDGLTFRPIESNFRAFHGITDKKLVLGVANVWSKEKGFNDFLKLRTMMDEQYSFVMVGLTKEQLSTIPNDIIGIQRTSSADELAEIYTAADVFVNMTYQDNYPTVNLEAISCGTPVVSYRTGGSCEAFDEESGIAVEKGNVEEIKNAIMKCIGFEKEGILKRAKEFSLYGDYSELYRC